MFYAMSWSKFLRFEIYPLTKIPENHCLGARPAYAASYHVDKSGLSASIAMVVISPTPGIVCKFL